MMTLDEAIQHCLEVAEQKEQEAKEAHVLSGMDCLECASEHRQLAEWLRELKRYKECESKCKSCPFFMEIGDVCGSCANYWRGDSE